MDVSRRAVLRGSALGAAALTGTGTGAGAAHLAGAKPAEAPDAVPQATSTPPLNPEVLIVGAGVGGVAAALALLRTGHTVVLTEPTNWIGGQLTSQAVPPDDHAWVGEGLGCTPTYREVRKEVRRVFKATYPINDKARANADLNPGNGWAHFGAEPSLWHSVLRSLLAPYEATERLRLVVGATPVSARTDRTRSGDGVARRVVRAVRFDTPDGPLSVRARIVIEASELGDLLPLADIPHVVGREKGGSRKDGGTGEPHNRAGQADPDCQQAFTVVAALSHSPDRREKPATSAAYDDFAKLYGSFDKNKRNVFDPTKDWAWDDGINFWQYRRVRSSAHLSDPGLAEVTLLNQVENDHEEFLLVPGSGPTNPVSQGAAIARAREQTLGLIRYFQTAYRRPDGDGTGWPGIFLVPSAVGTSTGLAQFPYVRESRRIRAERIVSELDIGVQARKDAGKDRATVFPDSVGTGAGPIDIHPTKTFPTGLFQPAYPFQIPLSALFPVETANVLAGGKTIGVTHIANGTYRYHPTEWAIGEIAGYVAAFALGRKLALRTVLGGRELDELQSYLDRQEIPRSWPADLVGQEVSSLSRGRS